MSADNENLRTAALYINNQLLSRGLLQDGQKINFCDPEGCEGGTDATMGKIMSIVNDLILRRDRDAEHRESLSTTLRTLRAENLRHTNDISKLSEKQADTQRKLDIAEASESAARSQLRSADNAVRGLKEEMARAKSLVAQTRASCANEVRRRDRQIEGLKKQLGDAGRARGSARNAPSVTTINVIADVGAEKNASPTRAASTNDPSYDLRTETNDFLTELAKGLSEENETLLALVRKTLGSLKEMSGWNKDAEGENRGDGYGEVLQTNCAEMENDLEAILENLRTILTNPSFVPIEEVEVREEEINRLKQGWLKMESRWQEAVHLIDGWRKRMMANGRAVNMEELDMGLRLSPVKIRDYSDVTTAPAPHDLSCVEEECTQDLENLRSPCPAPTGHQPEHQQEDESLHLEPAREYDVPLEDDSDSDTESSIFEDHVDMDELEASEPNIEILEQSAAYLSSPPLPAPPKLSPLKDSYSAGNRDAKPRRFEKPSDFTTIAEENSWDLADDADDDDEPKTSSYRTNLPRSPVKATQPPTPTQDEEPVQQAAPVTLTADSSLDDILLVQEPEGPPSPSPLPKDRARNAATHKRVKSNNDAVKDKPKAKAEPPKASSTDTNTATHQTTQQLPQRPRPNGRDRDISSRSMEDNLLPRPAVQETPSAAAAHRKRSPQRIAPPSGSRLPLPRAAAAPPQQSPLTLTAIAAKLAASERDADAARVRAKLKAARGASPRKRTNAPGTTARNVSASSTEGVGLDDSANGRGSHRSQTQQETIAEEAEEPEAAAAARQDQEVEKVVDDVDPVKRNAPTEAGQSASSAVSGEGRMPSPQKQQVLPKKKRETRASRVASRRRSTLNPWEMESLISGSVAVTSPSK